MKEEQVDLEELHREPTVVAVPPGALTEAGVLLDVEGSNLHDLKLAEDGHTVLLPQPTELDSDPLNWSSRRKHLILFTVAFGALCADFTSAAGTATIFLQGEEWNMSPNVVNYSGNFNVLMMGLGGLLWVPMTRYWGRGPTLFWATLIGLFFSLGSALAPTWPTFYAMRALMGWFLTAPQTISIAFLKDMFFFHERARKIGLWSTLYIASPYIGPCFANFIVGQTGNWRAVFWLNTGIVALQMCFILCFIDETWFDRDVPSSEHPPRAQGVMYRIPRLLGMWQIKHHSEYFDTVWSSYRCFAAVLTKPALVLILCNYLLIFAWAIGINITTSILFATPAEFGGYGYSNTQLGYLYFTPIIAVFLGEAFGHPWNDWTARHYIHRHHGVFEAESRLWTIYIGIAFMVAGLILVGQTLQHHLSVVGIIFGWGMNVFGVMLNSVSVTSYALDSYPMAPAEVAGWINFMRVIGGFSVGYFQQPWGQRVGFDASFGTQAAIVAFSGIFVATAHIYGHRLRAHFGPIRSK
ncbi:hypothetical protein BAUCODRAFT_123616 [Baudoinia panamericana UAMH 10762]|uniref:Major facilitator superfamily (MFS) profile domain-containing protein n=1 Tax=Baudoinia panamericana (strain UAMH 10762) TaxID=717646 RepID=M2N8I7_BAUPA|nr:uncharacterized protein BAUCODRAFT_123616 [Baudoinia panamericana UAMH 10762]EMC95145.1 hypothetical protein BAUCODRAFT_123616 [Baudoinia panamericana UAMH 10762]